MAIETGGPISDEVSGYDTLKALVQSWMARGDIADANAADMIRLAERRLNREIPAVEIDETLTGTIGERSIDVSAYSVKEPLALFIDCGNGQEPVQKQPNSTIAYSDTQGRPSVWSSDGDLITFDRPLDQEYTFRLRFLQRYSLSDGAATNWLLEHHEDVYLAAALVWGGTFVQDFPYASNFKSILDEDIPSVRNEIARAKRGILTVDKALGTPHSYYDGVHDE